MFMVGAVLLAPILTTVIMVFGTGLEIARETVVIDYASVFGFRLIAGRLKIALGRNISILLPGLATPLYSITMVVSRDQLINPDLC